jgi:putative pyruvate formate lyase activating enzyme
LAGTVRAPSSSADAISSALTVRTGKSAIAAAAALISDEELGGLMLRLQQSGCHNIKLVTPTHCVPNIVHGLRSGIAGGLHIPLVCHCGGYEPLDVLGVLEGIIDIYLPDFKYSDGAMAAKYSAGASDYPEVAAAAVSGMRSHVGNLVVDENGIGLSGLMIRHLVLPHNIAGTDQFVRFVTEKLGRSTYVNLMSQYRPAHEAIRYLELSRPITSEDYSQAVAWARYAGLTNVHRQA